MTDAFDPLPSIIFVLVTFSVCRLLFYFISEWIEEKSKYLVSVKLKTIKVNEYVELRQRTINQLSDYLSTETVDYYYYRYRPVYEIVSKSHGGKIVEGAYCKELEFDVDARGMDSKIEGARKHYRINSVNAGYFNLKKNRVFTKHDRHENTLVLAVKIMPLTVVWFFLWYLINCFGECG